MNAIINAAALSLPLTTGIWLALRLLPRRILSASARYVIWWFALLATVLLPMAYLPIHISPAPVAHVAPPPIQIVVPVPAAFIPLPVIRREPAPVGRTMLFPIRVATGAWTRWLRNAWIFTALLLLMRLILSCYTLLRQKARSRQLWIAIPSTRNACLKLSSEIPTPMAVGFLRPAILLPAHFPDNLTPEEIRQITLHESAHLSRRDDYALVVERAIEAVFAFHPAVRFIARQLDIEREIACDDRVVEATSEARSYARCLTRVAEMSGRTSFAAAAFFQDQSQLSRRIEVLLNQTRNTPMRLLKTRLAVVALTTLPIAWTLTKTPTLFAFSTPAFTTPAPKTIQPSPAPVPTELSKPQLRLVAQASAPSRTPSPVPSPVPTPIPNQTTDLVVLPVNAHTSDDDPLTNLSQGDFHVFEDDVEQPISRFAIDNSPIAIGVVAMNLTALNQQTLDALRAVEQTPGAKVEYTRPLNSSGWGTDMEAAFKQIQQLPNRRKLLLVIGDDAYWPPAAEFAQFQRDRAAMAGVDIVKTTEAALYSNPDAILRALMDQTVSYVVGYAYSGPREDGKYRKIKVHVDRPGVVLRFRSGYFYSSAANSCPEAISTLLSLPAASRCY